MTLSWTSISYTIRFTRAQLVVASFIWPPLRICSANNTLNDVCSLYSDMMKKKNVGICCWPQCTSSPLYRRTKIIRKIKLIYHEGRLAMGTLSKFIIISLKHYLFWRLSHQTIRTFPKIPEFYPNFIHIPRVCKTFFFDVSVSITQ